MRNALLTEATVFVVTISTFITRYPHSRPFTSGCGQAWDGGLDSCETRVLAGIGGCFGKENNVFPINGSIAFELLRIIGQILK
jgi:hypothetical protein